ncbi:class I SAM-dependent methyltransferase [Candidatus Woesebacteria bacterium]|nr:class I SAM-dependent methyltransferase [Candidatus Woesebacteria bacterium]
MKSNLVRDGYDKIAKTYLASRDRLKSGKHVSQLLKRLPKQSTILDLGCGAGVPVDDILLKAGHEVIGIDISSEQIKLARKSCPRGQFLVGDVSELSMDEYDVQAVISFYTIFHTPREEHSKLLKTFASYLKKGGLLLITMGDREFEGGHELHGEKMWSSQFGTAKNRSLVESAGFKIITDELDNSGGERHQVIFAEKR